MMWKSILGLSAIAAVMSCAPRRPAQHSPVERANFAVRVGRILDPQSGRYSPPAVILVARGMIADIVPATSFRADMADSTIDLSNLTALPGLIDAHVHLGIGGSVRANALADLNAGFTTVVDLGARTLRMLQFRDSINSGLIAGPRVLAAGMWVGVRGGTCEFGGIGVAGGPEAFRARVRENVNGGADIIKLCVSGWPTQAYSNPSQYEMNDDILVAAVDETHRLGRLAVAHDISLGGVQAAVRAHLDGLAHAAFLDSATAMQLKANGMFMIPTLATLAPDDTAAISRALVASVALAHRMGVPLVFGTDGGVLPHGRNAQEFRALRRAGVSPLDAIRSATTGAAAALRIADSVGTVRRGMVADLILVDGDPLTDLSVLERPRFVMSRGRVTRAP